MVSISRLLKITGLFCKRTLYKRLYSAKETYTFRYPAFLDGYCSAVEGLLVAVCCSVMQCVAVCCSVDWFEVGLGFPELVLFRLICILSVFCVEIDL